MLMAGGRLILHTRLHLLIQYNSCENMARMRNPQCCEYAETIEYTAAGSELVIARECSVCGQLALTPAWDRLSDSLERELSPRRLHAVSR